MKKSHDIDCPKCGTNMLKSYSDEAKFRMKVIVWNKDGMFAVCKSCSHEVKMDIDALKDIETKFSYEVDKNS
jgi:transcription elongation factor Elf1